MDYLKKTAVMRGGPMIKDKANNNADHIKSVLEGMVENG